MSYLGHMEHSKSGRKRPRITLLGAGPGDPELISLRGVELLQTADAVLYDALVSPELLAYAPDEAPRVFVGKRAGRHTFSQEEINRILVSYAREYGHVVRLKGGDPYVFGRGNEEFRYAQEYGIPIEVVPGVSSALGLADARDIPITAGAEGVLIMTGATSGGQVSEDLEVAAKQGITAVILMGMTNLPEIVGVYVREGRSEMPVAIIQDGSTPDERVLFARVDSVLDEVRRQGMSAPAVIIIGHPVNQYRQNLTEWLIRSTGGINNR